MRTDEIVLSHTLKAAVFVYAHSALDFTEKAGRIIAVYLPELGAEARNGNAVGFSENFSVITRKKVGLYFKVEKSEPLGGYFFGHIIYFFAEYLTGIARAEKDYAVVYQVVDPCHIRTEFFNDFSLRAFAHRRHNDNIGAFADKIRLVKQRGVYNFRVFRALGKICHILRVAVKVADLAEKKFYLHFAAPPFSSR